MSRMILLANGNKGLFGRKLLGLDMYFKPCDDAYKFDYGITVFPDRFMMNPPTEEGFYTIWDFAGMDTDLKRYDFFRQCKKMELIDIEITARFVYDLRHRLTNYMGNLSTLQIVGTVVFNGTHGFKVVAAASKNSVTGVTFYVFQDKDSKLIIINSMHPTLFSMNFDHSSNSNWERYKEKLSKFGIYGYNRNEMVYRNGHSDSILNSAGRYSTLAMLEDLHQEGKVSSLCPIGIDHFEEVYTYRFNLYSPLTEEEINLVVGRNEINRREVLSNISYYVNEMRKHIPDMTYKTDTEIEGLIKTRMFFGV